MSKIKSFFIFLGHIWYLKYVVVCILGILIVGFLDENSVWAHIRYRQQVAELESEIEKYESIHQKNEKQINELRKNPKAIEKIARERYFMKANNEDVFVLSEE